MSFRWSALAVAPLLMFTVACGGDEEAPEGGTATPTPTVTDTLDPDAAQTDDGADADGGPEDEEGQSGGGSNDASRGDGRPSAQELADAIRASDPAGEISDGEAQCLAEVLGEAGFSDEYLRAIVDGDLEYQISDADADVMVDAVGPMMECVEQ